MRWFSNARIGMKLIIGFSLVLVVMLGIVGFAIYTADKIDAEYSYVEEFPLQRRVLWADAETQYFHIRRAVSHGGAPDSGGE
jgi:CHASE3 domain sensor protein